MEIWQKNAIENICSIMAQHDLSQAALSREAKISKGHLNAVLKGKEPITRQLVATVANYFGRDTNWFYEDHSRAKPPSPAGPTLSDALEILAAFQTATPDTQRRVLQILGLEAPESPESLLREIEHSLLPKEVSRPKSNK